MSWKDQIHPQRLSKLLRITDLPVMPHGSQGALERDAEATGA